MSEPHVRLWSGLRSLSLAAVVDRVASFAGLALLLWFLSLEEYGAFALILGAYSLVAFVDLGQGELVVARCSAFMGNARPDASAALFRSYAAVTATVLVVALAVAGGAVATFAPAWQHLALPALAGAVGPPARNLLLTHLRVRQDFQRIRRAENLRNGFLAAGYAVALPWAGAGLSGVLYAYAFAHLAPLLVHGGSFLAEVARGLVRPAAGPLLELLAEEGKWQVARYGVVSVHSAARPWLIGGILGLEAVALFQAAKTVVSASLDLVPMKEVVTPLMSERSGDPSTLRRLYADTARLGTWILALLTAGIVAAMPIVAVAFPQYADAVPLARFMALGSLVSGLAAAQVGLLYALRMQRFHFVTNAFRLAFLFATVPLVLVWGLWGAVAAFVLDGFATAALRHAYLRRNAPDVRVPVADVLRPRASDGDAVRFMIFGR